MPDYLVCANEAAARDRSRQIATDLNCGPTTQYWFGWQLHPTDGRAALIVPDGQDAGRAQLTEAERAALVAQLSADWTPDDGEGAP